MRKASKRFITLVVVVMLLFSISVTAYASEIQPRIDFVATMKVVSFTGGGVASSFGYNGHSFLIFTNTWTSPITVGHFPVAPGESITIGTFGNRANHVGIWYNIEGCLGTSTTTYALVTALTVAELQQVNQTINSNDSWSALSNNCSAFAVKVWNSVSSVDISGWNPADVVSSIRSQDYYVTNVAIPSKTSSNIARHTSTSYEMDPTGYYSS